ncbi:transmembrane protein 26-like [Asterias amurensis]|uniref:transmembrane protein 26-like n=1 Tax=Asterias amurensis TaxID=7602 RepID=UPI003AB3FBB7
MKHVNGEIVDDVQKDNGQTQWILVVEQMLPLLLIVGRWLLPKGSITRNELSELLLVYFATAADIIEFFDGFNEVSVKYDRSLVFTLLTLWSWSLIQFALVMTSIRDQRGTSSSQSKPTTPSDGQRKIKRALFKRFPRLASSRVVRPLPTSETNDGLMVIPIKPKHEIREDTVPTFTCLDTSVWSIVASLLLQDAPFLVFRLTLILRYQVYSHTNVFFTCKNSLVIVLQTYRIFVLHIERREKVRLQKKATDATAKKIANLKKNGFLFVHEKNLPTKEHDEDPYDAVSMNSSQ